MREVGDRFQNMYFAAKEGNWGLAAYMSKYMNAAMNPAKLTKPAEYPDWANFYSKTFDPVNKAIMAQNFENCVKAPVQVQPLPDDGYQDVHRDGHPDLGLHGVGRSAVEGLDPQMPLDPFEEQFHLPPLLVDIGNGLRRDGEQVGQKHKAPMVLSVVESDAAQRLRVILPGLGPHKRDDLIDADPASLVHRGRRQASEAQIPFGADHEESRKAM